MCRKESNSFCVSVRALALVNEIEREREGKVMFVMEKETASEKEIESMCV